MQGRGRSLRRMHSCCPRVAGLCDGSNGRGGGGKLRLLTNLTKIERATILLLMINKYYHRAGRDLQRVETAFLLFYVYKQLPQLALAEN